MRPKSTISIPKVDDEHPHHFHTSFHCWERGCPCGEIESNLDITILYNENLSLGPGSVVGEKSKKRGQIGKISASEARRAVAWGGGKGATLSPSLGYLSARFAPQFLFFFANADFSSFSHNAEPGTRLRRPRYDEQKEPRYKEISL